MAVEAGGCSFYWLNRFANANVTRVTSSDAREREPTAVKSKPLRRHPPLLRLSFHFPLISCFHNTPRPLQTSKGGRKKKNPLPSHASSKTAGGLNFLRRPLSSPLLHLRQASPALTKAPISASLIAEYIFISPPMENQVEEIGLERETSLR